MFFYFLVLLANRAGKPKESKVFKTPEVRCIVRPRRCFNVSTPHYYNLSRNYTELAHVCFNEALREACSDGKASFSFNIGYLSNHF